MKIAQKSFSRIQEMIRKDKDKLSVPFLNMVKNDIYNILSSYFVLSIQDINLNYDIDEEGFYKLEFCVKSNSVKKINFIEHN